MHYKAKLLVHTVRTHALAPLPVYAEVLESWVKATGFAFHGAVVPGLQRASYSMEANSIAFAWWAAHEPNDRVEIHPFLHRHLDEKL